MAIIKYDASSKRTNYFTILVTGVKTEDAALSVLSRALITGQLDDGRRYIMELLNSAIDIMESNSLYSKNLGFSERRNYRAFYRIMRNILIDFDKLMTYNRADGTDLGLTVLKLYKAKIATINPIDTDKVISNHKFKVVWYRMTELGDFVDSNEYNHYLLSVKYDYRSIVDGYILFGPGPNVY